MACVVLIALAVLIGGMLAVSAQYGCCHHWLHFFFVMPFHFWYLIFWLVIFDLHIILLGFCLHFLFLFDITWCIYYRDVWVMFWWGSYSSVYVPPPLFVFPVILMICIPSFFSSCYVLCTYFFFHIWPFIFSFAYLCGFSPRLDENFWGVYAYAFYHMQLYVDFEMCILNILCYI